MWSSESGEDPRVRGAEWLQASLPPPSLSHAACGPSPDLTPPCSLPPPPPASNAQYIVAALDDGSFFVWERRPPTWSACCRATNPSPTACSHTPATASWPPASTLLCGLEPPAGGEGRGRGGRSQAGRKEGGMPARPPAELVWGVGWERSHSLTEAKGLPGEELFPGVQAASGQEPASSESSR